MPEPKLKWFQLSNPERISTPALCVHPERVRKNIQRMLHAVGDQATRLCPHVKTIKSVELIRLMVDAGIRQFKCATVAEGEAAIEAGASDILLAIPASLPLATRWLEMAKARPQTRLATIVDSVEGLEIMCALAKAAPVPLRVWVDLNLGMNRTGIRPGKGAKHLAEAVHASPHLELAGLHAYDGHLHQDAAEDREKACNAWHLEVRDLATRIHQHTGTLPPILAGGTPTFPMHAATPDLICSPGTCVLWDAGYAAHFKDLDFDWAAVLMCRVISKPATDSLCLDLGHKSVASEMVPPRVHFLNMEVDAFLSHSEEHLVVASPKANTMEIGSIAYGIPTHICPTVALHQELQVVHDNRVTETWEVIARNRRIHF